MRFFSLLLALPAVLAAPLENQVRAEDTVAGSWIVSLKPSARMNTVLTTVFALTGARPTHKYNIGSFRGFSIDNVPDALNILGNLPAIAGIEPNGMVYASALVSQANPPYGLARISHRNPGATSYIYDDSAGQGTFSYIIDTVSTTPAYMTTQSLIIRRASTPSITILEDVPSREPTSFPMRAISMATDTVPTALELLDRTLTASRRRQH